MYDELVGGNGEGGGGGEGEETKSFSYAMTRCVMTSFTIAEKSENLRFPVVLQKVTSCHLGRIRMV